MTPLSSRFAVPLAVLLLASAVPVWLHMVTRPVADDCASPEAFFGSSRIGGVEVETGRLGGGVVDRVENYTKDLPTAPLLVRVVRTLDPVPLYVNPIAFGFDSVLYLRPSRVRRIEAGDDVLPVHWGTYERGGTVWLEAWMFSHGGEPVRHPFVSGLGMALPQLLEGTRPLTLFVVAGATSGGDLPALRRSAERWLADAWQEFESACRF